jgi:hypothetical protein
MSVFISTAAIIFDAPAPLNNNLHVGVHLNSRYYHLRCHMPLRLPTIAELPLYIWLFEAMVDPGLSKMDFTAHVPPFAEPLPPPPPLLMLLQETDLPYRCLQRLMISENLPLTNVRFHPYHSFHSKPKFHIAQMLTNNNYFAGPHIQSRRPLTPAHLPSPVLVDRSSALADSSTNTKALSDDELSDLSSLSPSPDPSHAPGHNAPQTASSTNLTVREPVSKTRIERPTGASRAPFSEVVYWDDRLIKSIKVRQQLTDYA